ncbi:polysaccharide deacetylase family protein [Mobiluncus sp.]|uniref:polysaccharide deacetylase family protein n=1 Tax=Mobiluncus sp. TaxID=47293 RepID=UPI002A91D64A|nr:polysaccharide deacetylase family protein [Mobiluncus sp.]MDY6077470.1 polysaccharide deacetylase family protein [Mobiluncus sp.]
MSRKSKIWIASILAVISVAAAIGGITMYLVNKWEVIVTLKGDSTSTVEYGDTWKDPGATAYGTSTLFTFTHDDLKLHTTGKVDTSKVGTYEITYAAKYRGVEGKKTRKVTVRDSKPPAITVDGGEQITLPYGLPWQDSYSATDNVDGDLTAKVQVDGQVNVNAAGSYTLRYQVSDSSGNQGTATRQVTVMTPVAPNADPAAGLDKVIYLTFDDGPGPATSHLLDILATKGVKATFFVTNTMGHPDMIGRAYREGHSVGIHTYTHQYSQIYASDDAYWADFDRMAHIIRDQTGQDTRMMRFPGGSSNTVSRNYSPGIMSRLTRLMVVKGYTYFDWNVDSGDGTGHSTSASVFQRITAGVQGKSVSVVLCHDTHPTTVDAMPQVIDWAKQNGYTFLPLAPGSYPAHHRVAN